MEYRIELARRAEQDIEGDFQYIHAEAPAAAVKWRHGIYDKIKLLRTYPTGYGFAPENEDARCELCQTLYKQWRILFTVREETVHVLTVRHGARQFLSAEELDELTGPE